MKDFEECFKRIGDYAESIGCSVDYSKEKSLFILFNNYRLCQIDYHDNDIFEQYASILDRESYIIEFLPDKYIPYNMFEKVITKIKNIFCKQKDTLFFHVYPNNTYRLIPKHYKCSKEGINKLTFNGYYVTEEQLYKLLEYHITTNFLNMKKYRIAVKKQQIEKEFENG